MNSVELVWMTDLLVYIVMPVLAIALALSVLRLVRGPGLPDRILALDLIGMLGIGVAMVYAVLTGQTALLDFAMVLALLAFLSTLAFAAYIERRSQSWL